MRLAFSIPGKPKGKERPRVAPGQSRPYTPKQTVEAEKAIRALFLEKFPDHQPWTGPVMLRFTAVFELPKSWPAELRAAADMLREPVARLLEMHPDDLKP